MPRPNPGPRLKLYGPDARYGAKPRAGFKDFVWYVVWCERGVRKERSTGASRDDLKLAQASLRAFVSARVEAGTPPKRLAYLMHRRAKYRAQARGVAFTLTIVDVEDMLAATRGRCSVTGIPFDYASLGDRFKRPWAPSLDRIRPALGYTPLNCRVVCTAANLAMHVWGEDVLRRLAESYVGWTLSNREVA